MSADSENGKTKGSSKLSLLGNIALILGLLVVIAGGVVGWLMPPPPPPPVATISLTEEEPAPSESTGLLEVLSPSEEDTPDVEVEEVLEVEEVMLVDANQIPPLPIKYYVQVANCLDRECVGEHRRLLSRQGYRKHAFPRSAFPSTILLRTIGCRSGSDLSRSWLEWICSGAQAE